MEEKYKYATPTDEDIKKGIVYLEVIKSLHWQNRPSHSLSIYVPIGAITWTTRDRLKEVNGVLEFYKGEFDAVILEGNIYASNFDTSGFKILHTSIQKIK